MKEIKTNTLSRYPIVISTFWHCWYFLSSGIWSSSNSATFWRGAPLILQPQGINYPLSLRKSCFHPGCTCWSFDNCFWHTNWFSPSELWLKVAGVYLVAIWYPVDSVFYLQCCKQRGVQITISKPVFCKSQITWMFYESLVTLFQKITDQLICVGHTCS